ncbi:MAG: hypothetical protein HYV07_06605 [Deltaproteobacteria bacterium]|nr:hypothetical protein [Deltaproteobacteria bacterium]
MAIFLAAGCGEDLRFVSWPKETLELAFLVRLGAHELTVVSGPFGMRDGAPDPGPERYSSEPTEPIFLLGFDEDTLRTLHPLVDLSKLHSARLVSEASSCAGGRRVSGERRQLAVPVARAHSTPLTDAARATLGSWRESLEEASLSLAVRPCPSAGLAMTTFGAHGPVLPDGATILGAPRTLSQERYSFFDFSDSIRLPDGSWLVWTAELIYRFRQPGTFESSGASAEWAPQGDFPSLPGRYWRLSKIVRTRSADQYLGLFTRTGDDGQNDAAVLAVLALTETGLRIDSRTFVEAGLSGLATAPDGRFFAAGTGGSFAAGTPTAGPTHVQPGGRQASMNLVAATLMTDRPFLVSALDASLRFVRWPDSGPVLEDVSLPNRNEYVNPIGRIVAPDGTPELWAVDYSGQAFSYSKGRGWGEEVIEFPAEAQPCAPKIDDCGRITSRDSYAFFTGTSERTFAFAMDHCSAIFELNPALGCVAPVPIDGAIEIEVTDEETFRFQDAYADERGIGAVAKPGWFYVSE